MFLLNLISDLVVLVLALTFILWFITVVYNVVLALLRDVRNACGYARKASHIGRNSPTYR